MAGIETHEYFNAADYFVDRNISEGRGDKIAIYTEHRNYTYKHLQKMVNKTANALQHLGMRIEDRIMMLMLVLGILLHGRLYVPVRGDIISYLATLANIGLGFLYFFLAFVMGYRGQPEAVNSDYGTLFILAAGLMNLLLLIEVYDIALGKRRAA